MSGSEGTLNASVYAGGYTATAATWCTNADVPCPASVAQFNLYVTKGRWDDVFILIPGYSYYFELSSGQNVFTVPLEIIGISGGHPFELGVISGYDYYDPNIPPVVVSGTMSIVPQP